MSREEVPTAPKHDVPSGTSRSSTSEAGSREKPAVSVLHGQAIEGALRELAALRIAVFREYPYLYEGTVAYEENYLASYARCDYSTVVLARDGERVVGASTAMPLTVHSQAVVQPLKAAGFDPDDVYYFGESVLLPAYRGLGLGHRFFDERERAARERGYRFATFCAVVRPDDHPKKPSEYVPHDAFWTKRGYQKRQDIVGELSWLEVGEAAETAKPMVFWLKTL